VKSVWYIGLGMSVWYIGFGEVGLVCQFWYVSFGEVGLQLDAWPSFPFTGLTLPLVDPALGFYLFLILSS
jgi:hypothetical protein